MLHLLLYTLGPPFCTILLRGGLNLALALPSTSSGAWIPLVKKSVA